MNTHESYVSLEVAKLLKEAGFDWGVNSCWNCYGIPVLSTDMGVYRNYNEDDNIFSAPTLDVTQRWLREVKDIQVHVISYRDQKTGKLQGWCYKVYEMSQGWEFNYFTYEEALEAGIKKCLTLILEE